MEGFRKLILDYFFPEEKMSEFILREDWAGFEIFYEQQCFVRDLLDWIFILCVFGSIIATFFICYKMIKNKNRKLLGNRGKIKKKTIVTSVGSFEETLTDFFILSQKELRKYLKGNGEKEYYLGGKSAKEIEFLTAIGCEISIRKIK